MSLTDIAVPTMKAAPQGININEYISGDRQLVPNSSLPREKYEELSKTMTGIAQEELVMSSLLRDAGLVEPVDNIGVSQYEWDIYGNMTPARVGMTFPSLSQNDTPDYDKIIVPIPVISKDFNVDARKLAAGKRGGTTDLATINTEQATRSVAEAVDALVLTGALECTQAGFPVYGMLNQPDINTYTLAGGGWDQPGADIINDVLNMIAGLRLANYRNGLTLLIPDNYWDLLQGDYSANKGQSTYIERIQAMSSISKVVSVPTLPNSTVVLFKPDKRVVQMPVTEDITMVEVPKWGQNEYHIYTLMSIAPKADIIGQSGILVATP